MAKIETLVDTFEDLDNWEDALVSNASITAAGGYLSCNADASNDTHYMLTRTSATDHTFDNTWMTIECWDYAHSSQSLTLTGILGVCDNFSNVLLAAMLEYMPGTNEIDFKDGSGTVHATIPNPAGSIYLAVDLDSINGYTLYYSIDAGDNWVDFYTGTYDTEFALPHHAIAGALTIGPGPFSVLLDNFNVVEFPHVSGPISIDVDPAAITVEADPRVRVLLGPYHVEDISDATANITVTVNLDDPLLGIKIPVDPATVTVEAVPFDSITFGPPTISFTPAQVQVTVNPPLSIELGEADPVIEVITADVDVVVNLDDPIVGAFVVGNPFAYPHTIIESGSQAFDMTGMDFEAGEGDPSLDSYTFLPWLKTQWIKYVSQTPAQLTITHSGTDDYGIQAFEGTSLDNLIEIGRTTDTTGPLVVDINSGVTYIRISTSTEAETVTLTWSYIPSAPPLFMDVLSPTLEYTPDTVTVAVQGGAPNEDITFIWSPPVSDLISGATPRPITITSISADFEGNILVGSLEIPAVYAGTYTITATGEDSGRQATGSFIVLNDPLDQDAEEDATEPVASITVRWLWDDGRGHTWIMPKNPDRMTSVIKKKTLLAEHTTAGAGQHIIWQGATPATSWSFNGTITTEDEYDELVFFHSLNRKFYITDHRNRTFIVTSRSLQMTPRKNSDNFWTFDYTMDCFLYGEA